MQKFELIARKKQDGFTFRRKAVPEQSEGFTLVELLVVIAIIAVLVLLVILALDPLERIKDATDRRAQYSVRQAASAVSTCLTNETAKSVSATAAFADGDGGSPAETCADESAAGFLVTDFYINNPAALTGVQILADDDTSPPDICTEHANPGGHGAIYWRHSTGVVTDPEVDPWGGGAPVSPCTLAYP